MIKKLIIPVSIAFLLAGLMPVAPDGFPINKEAAAGIGSKAKEVWVLEYLFEGRGTGWAKNEGWVEFEIPSPAQSFEASGPLTSEGANINKSQGVLIIKGRVNNGQLSFVPDCNITIQTTSGFSAPLDLFEDESEITMTLVNGQEKVFEYRHGAEIGRVVWRLKTPEQVWEVRVTGFELDDTQKPSQFDDADGKVSVLQKRMRFDWNITGRFTLGYHKKGWRFKSGSVRSAKVSPVADFKPSNMYQCSEVKYASRYPISRMVGEPLMGHCSGGKIKLEWPSFMPEGYAKCTSGHPAFPKTPYEGWFRSADFTQQIGIEPFPLKDGFSKTITKKDWLSYTIVLKRLQ